MSETITAIYEYKGAEYDIDSEGEPMTGWGKQSEEGWKIETTEQVITLAISNGQSCCENWGYLMSEDWTGKFLEAELRGISLTDTNRTKKTFSGKWTAEMEEKNPTAIFIEQEGQVMFVDIETDKGTLQFVAYNSHNGYYGHRVRVSSKQLRITDTL
jgi:hypothetical protein